MWGNSTDQNRAFIAQKKCIRAIYGLRPDESCRPMFKKLELLPLPSLYIYETCMFVRKHIELPNNAADLFPRNRRDPHRLVLGILPRLSKYNKSCVSMCVRIYNKIPISLKTLNVRSFQNKLHDFLCSHSFYSVREFFDNKF